MNATNFDQVIIGADVWAALQKEKDLMVPKSRFRGGYYDSEALCRWQSEKSGEGYTSVELVESLYGWSVRYASGLQDFALLAGARRGNVDGTLQDAVRFAYKWASANPEKRFVFAPSKVAHACCEQVKAI